MLAFIIPAFLMLLIVIVGGFAPFGKVSILVADMQYQFVSYIGYLKSVFFGNNDLLYSFSKTFGGDMTGFSAYYLGNPFYLFLLLFPNEILPEGIVFMIILICGGCGLSFYIMLSGIWGKRISGLIFSSAYALMGFIVAYINCIHYFFSVMMLPLVILGLFKITRTRKFNLLYVLSAALSVISNYYIGYMILIFTALFFLFILISDIVEFDGIKDRIHTSVIVLYNTLLAVGISAFSLCATVMSLRGQKSSSVNLSLARTFNIREFFAGLYSGSFHGNISDGAPIIYSGVVSVVFLILYFLSKKVKLKEKICAAVLFAFIVLSFLIDALNVAWHGFAHPIGFPYRNSFIFSFLVLFFGYRGFYYLREGFDKKQANIVVVIFGLCSLMLILIKSNYVGLREVSISGLIVCLALILVVSMQEKNRYIVPALMGLMILQFSDICYNGSLSLDAYFEDKDSEEVTLDTYKNYIKETQSIIDYINANDPGFYRTEKLYRKTHNDPMMFSYNGLSHFSSCETDQVKRFMGNLGFRDNGLWAYYSSGSTTFADCLMGVKYMLSQYDETCKPYEYYYLYNNKFAYKNPYALSLGFGMKNSVKSLYMNENKFELQNDIASSFSGTHFKIYRPVNVSEVRLHNVTQDGNIYRRNSDEEAYIEYELLITSDDFIYMYFDAPSIQNCSLMVNDIPKDPYFTKYDWNIRECGYFSPGEQVSVRFTLEQDEIEIDNYYFYYEKPEIIKSWYKEAIDTTCNITKESSSHLIADVNMSNNSDLLVFSIPYEKDWVVKVDGNKVNTLKVMDALLAINLKEGHHEVELRYIPRGLVIGLPISLLSLITTFCVYILQKKKKTQE